MGVAWVVGFDLIVYFSLVVGLTWWVSLFWVGLGLLLWVVCLICYVLTLLVVFRFVDLFVGWVSGVWLGFLRFWFDWCFAVFENCLCCF